MLPIDDTTLTTLGSVVTFLFSQLTSVVTFMTSSPIILVAFGIFVVGGIIGLVSRIFHAI